MRRRADTVEGGSAQGAMSWAFQEALSKNPKQSYIQLLNSIRAELSGKYSQKPQLSCSHPLGGFSLAHPLIFYFVFDVLTWLRRYQLTFCDVMNDKDKIRWMHGPVLCEDEKMEVRHL